MSKVLFIGDPHLKINRFDLAKRFLSWLNFLIEEQRPDIVVNLGDTWDSHAVIRSEVAAEFMKHVYQTLDKKIPYIYLIGNHDQFRPNDSTYHAMLPYKDRIKDLYVIDKTTDIFGMTFVPYQSNASLFPKKTLPICVAHQTFIGANYGHINATEGVDPSNIEGCDIIISGHIHTKSVLGLVTYVGSPFSQSAADVGQVKGITVLDTSTYQQTFFPCPLPMWRKLSFELSKNFTVGDVHTSLTQNIKDSKDHWVLEINGPKAEIIGYLDSDPYKQLIKEIDVKVKTNFNDKEKKKISIEAKSMEHILSEYVSKVYSGSIDKDKLIRHATSVLSEARSLNDQ